VATYVSNRLGQELLALTGAPESREEASAAASALREAHHRTQRALEDSTVDCDRAGCTGVCIVLLRPTPGLAPPGEDATAGNGEAPQGTAARPGAGVTKMLVSNIGDSRAVLGSSVPRRGSFGTAQIDASAMEPVESRLIHSLSTVRHNSGRGRGSSHLGRK
jgi:serine/threonine protein phosphatase PrpC